MVNIYTPRPSVCVDLPARRAAESRPASARKRMVRAGAARREQRHAKRALARATRGNQKYKNQKGDGLKRGAIRKTARPAGRNKHGRGHGRRFDPEAEVEDEDDEVRDTC